MSGRKSASGQRPASSGSRPKSAPGPKSASASGHKSSSSGQMPASKPGHKDTTKVYHYTDRQGIQGIVGTGRIRPSTDVTRDAMLGKGAYFTTMPPNRNSTKIAQNNWDDGPRHAKSMVKEGRTEFAVEVHVPKHELVANPGSRNVMMKPGGVNLHNYPHSIYQRENGSKVHKLL